MKGNMLGKVSPTQKDKCYMICLDVETKEAELTEIERRIKTRKVWTGNRNWGDIEHKITII